jgi:predicted MFS family arabinose efflux permease
MVFDWPETARFLTPDERLRVCRRLIADKHKQPDVLDKREMHNALRDWKTYLYCIINMGSVAPVYAFSLFLPTILVGMGYTGTRGQLMSVPPYAAGAVCTVLVGVIADRTLQRGYCSMACSLVSIAGFIMLISSADPRIQYAGVFLGAMGIYPSIPNGFSWAANNTEGSLKRGITIGMMAGWGNINGVASSNIYIQQERPRYFTGHGTVLGYLVAGQLLGSATMHVLLRIENRKRLSGRRERTVAGKTEIEVYMMGDKRPNFIYTL